MDHLKTQGISVPKLGLGTFRMQGDACRAAVESALSIGYRHIDTAEMYANEEAIGAAIAASGVPRGELHVTTKVWHENLGTVLQLVPSQCAAADTPPLTPPSAHTSLPQVPVNSTGPNGG